MCLISAFLVALEHLHYVGHTLGVEGDVPCSGFLGNKGTLQGIEYILNIKFQHSSS